VCLRGVGSADWPARPIGTFQLGRGQTLTCVQIGAFSSTHLTRAPMTQCCSTRRATPTLTFDLWMDWSEDMKKQLTKFTMVSFLATQPSGFSLIKQCVANYDWCFQQTEEWLLCRANGQPIHKKPPVCVPMKMKITTTRLTEADFRRLHPASRLATEDAPEANKQADGQTEVIRIPMPDADQHSKGQEGAEAPFGSP